MVTKMRAFLKESQEWAHMSFFWAPWRCPLLGPGINPMSWLNFLVHVQFEQETKYLKPYYTTQFPKIPQGGV